MKNDIIKRSNLFFKIIVFLILLGITAILFCSIEKTDDWTDPIYKAIQLMGSNIDAGSISGNLGLSIMKIILPFFSVLIGIDVIIEVVNADLLTRLEGLLSGWFNIFFVYGDSETVLKYLPKEKIRDSKGRRVRFVVMNDGAFIKARRYILLFKDDYNAITFYETTIRQYADRRKALVYINLNNISRQNVRGENFVTININDTIARTEWKSNEWLSHASEKLKTCGILRVAIVGNSVLAEKMIEHALCLNILGEKGSIEYHIWGCGDRFISKHHVICNKIYPDKIIIHKGYGEDKSSGTYSIKDFEGMDDIFLCEDESNNLQLAADILAYTNATDNIVSPTNLYIRADSKTAIHFLETSISSKRICFFGTNDLGNSLLKDAVTNADTLEELGQKVNAYYYKIKDEDILGRRKKWLESSSFDKASSISSADYREVLRFLKNRKIEDELLPELEHIRWCRFSYLYNWERCEEWGYGNKVDQTKKDEMRSFHRHQDLVPYNDLPDEEKRKDLRIIKDILEIKV